MYTRSKSASSPDIDTIIYHRKSLICHVVFKIRSVLKLLETCDKLLFFPAYSHRTFLISTTFMLIINQ